LDRVVSQLVGIYCDLGRSLGAGHFVRCSALGAALTARGARVEIVANLDEVPWAREQAHDLGLTPVQGADPAGVPALARVRGWDTAVVDSYRVAAADLAGLDVPLAAVDDEDLRPLPAALVVNQNLNATDYSYDTWRGARVLRGPGYALLRPRIAMARPATYVERDWSTRRQRVLIVLGGTDAGGGAAAVTRLALDALSPVELRVIASNQAAFDAVRAVQVPPGSTVEASLPVLAIEELMNWADLVISASGSTVWELCCLGAPMALAIVADNQVSNYGRLLDEGLAVGLGMLGDLIGAPVPRLPAVLGSPQLNEYGRRAWQTVDGQGADRVAEAVLSLVSSPTAR
jgi:spore coat polysaccharide biosynthesis predicted glycosyltransferase SpsG